MPTSTVVDKATYPNLRISIEARSGLYYEDIDQIFRNLQRTMDFASIYLLLLDSSRSNDVVPTLRQAEGVADLARKQARWRVRVKRLRYGSPAEFVAILDAVGEFLGPSGFILYAPVVGMLLKDVSQSWKTIQEARIAQIQLDTSAAQKKKDAEASNEDIDNKPRKILGSEKMISKAEADAAFTAGVQDLVAKLTSATGPVPQNFHAYIAGLIISSGFTGPTISPDSVQEVELEEEE